MGKIFPVKQLKYFEVQNSSLRQLNLIMFLGIDIFMAINIKVGLNNVVCRMETSVLEESAVYTFKSTPRASYPPYTPCLFSDFRNA